MSTTTRPIRVLCVDDDPDLASLTATFLEREDDRIEVVTAADAGAGMDELDGREVDCVVSDYDMPGPSGIEFLETVREAYPDLPFVLFTAKGSEEIASRAISAGVTDYLGKGSGTDQYAVLANRVANAVERYRAEREADRTRAHLAAIAENTNDAIVTIDEESTVRFANPAVYDLFGYRPDDLEGEPLSALIPERYRDAHREAFDRYVETGEPTIDWRDVEFPGKRADGEEIPLSISFSEFEMEGERRFTGIIRDVTDRVGRERELELRTALLEAQAEATIDGLLVVDEDRDIIQYNERFLDIWDLDEGLVEGSRDDPLVLDRALERVEDPDAFLRRTRYLYDHPEEEARDEFRLEDGRWIDRYSAPVRDEDGRYYGRLWVFRDVTGRVERERELKQHKERLEEFASIVSHDLRNPLNVAEGQLELAREDPEGGHLDAVEDAHDRMWVLIDDLLALARANESMADPEPVDLAALAESCWRNVETRRADLRVETDRVVVADENRLGQLLRT